MKSRLGLRVGYLVLLGLTLYSLLSLQNVSNADIAQNSSNFLAKYEAKHDDASQTIAENIGGITSSTGMVEIVEATNIYDSIAAIEGSRVRSSTWAHSFSAAPTSTTPTADDLSAVLCNVINFATGSLGKSIAVIILISLALGLFIGKVSWGVAIATAVGMGLLFGAQTMINSITANTSNSSSFTCTPPANN